MEASVLTVCRLCRCGDDVLLNDIFDDITDDESVVSKMWNCLSLKVSVDDGLPRFICHRCVFSLNRFNIFRKICHESNIFFLKHYQPSFVRKTTHIEAMDMKTEPEDVSPVSCGIGRIVENSERRMDGFESDGCDATDESYYVLSRPHSNVEFEGVSDPHLSNSQSSAFEQVPYVESVPKIESPSVTGIGRIVENSQRTLDGFESDGCDATDESYYVSSRPHSNVKFEGVSDPHLSNSQSSAFEQVPYVESVPKIESPSVTGIGCIIEGSERTLDGFESDGSDMSDELYGVSSRPHSIAEFDKRGSDPHLSNSQSSAFEQAPYVDSVPENENPSVTGIGHIVEGSERTLDGFESDGNDVTDEFHSRPLSNTLPYFNSNECGRGPEDSQASQCVSGSQSVVNKSYVPQANSGPLTLAVDTGTACVHFIVHHHYN